MTQKARSNVLALIPARQGSKSIPHKNIRSIGGKPMLAYSIEHALASERISRVVVSTDSEYYADIARSHGAEVPFLRPAEIAQDLSTDWEVFAHALQWLDQHEGFLPDICVHLRPTCPIRNPTDIDQMIQILEQDPQLDAVRSVAESPETPFKMWFRGENGLLNPVIQTDIKEAYNQPRQGLPTTYLQNASIDVVRTRTILEKKSMTGDRIYGYIMQENFDVDYEDQLLKVAGHLLAHDRGEEGPKTFCFDIDGVVACLTPNNDYTKADCHPHTIEVINTLYNRGHYIILFTARGTKTGIDWAVCTADQLKRWGVKYHELKFGKPAADYYIDDRLITIEALQKLINL